MSLFFIFTVSFEFKIEEIRSPHNLRKSAFHYYSKWKSFATQHNPAAAAYISLQRVLEMFIYCDDWLNFRCKVLFTKLITQKKNHIRAKWMKPKNRHIEYEFNMNMVTVHIESKNVISIS